MFLAGRTEILHLKGVLRSRWLVSVLAREAKSSSNRSPTSQKSPQGRGRTFVHSTGALTQSLHLLGSPLSRANRLWTREPGLVGEECS